MRSSLGGASAALLSALQYTPPESSSNEILGSEKSVASDPFSDPDEHSLDIQNLDDINTPNSASEKVDAVTIESNTTAVKDADLSLTLSEGSDLMPVPLRIAVNKDKSNPASPIVGTGTDPEAIETFIEVHSPPETTTAGQSLYILQPNIYSPRASPLPSPQVPETAGQQMLSRELPQPRSRLEVTSPRVLYSPSNERLSHRSTTLSLSSGQSGGTPSALIRPSTGGVSSAVPEWFVDRPVERDHISSTLMKTTSIRERVSLRTTPPDAIHVPSLNAPQLQQPGFVSPRTFESYRTSADPDSSSIPNNDRTASVQFTDVPRIRRNHTAHGSIGSNGSIDSRDYSLPIYPNILPSPNSDVQYFRPVQASPHSPLQQRPHTAGPHAADQTPSRPFHLRNAPSSMGMSMLSSATAMTQDSKGQPTLKKKRSAFGWLKKAFTLDEEERLTFDQRRQIQERNLYYDTRSPKFLDGKRVR